MFDCGTSQEPAVPASFYTNCWTQSVFWHCDEDIVTCELHKYSDYFMRFIVIV